MIQLVHTAELIGLDDTAGVALERGTAIKGDGGGAVVHKHVHEGLLAVGAGPAVDLEAVRELGIVLVSGTRSAVHVGIAAGVGQASVVESVLLGWPDLILLLQF